jgi:cytidylate kinase
MNTLLIINGYAGAGKSSTASRFAKKYGFALIAQDIFLFQLNAFSEKEGGLTEKDHTIAIKNIHDCALNYMRTKRDIVIEGALVSLSKKDPLDIKDFIKLGQRMNYKVVVVTFIADQEVRIKRQKKRKHVVPKSIDKKLREANRIICEEISDEIIIDTSKLSINTVVKKLHQLL